MTINEPLEALNERELEIIPLLAEGLSNKEIANRLFLAPNTVKWYVRQLNSKLDTSSREEVVERAEKLGLLHAEKTEDSYVRPRQNIPRQTTPFIGRDAELDEIHSLLENSDVRLLTILAQGGMGKTRLALEALEQQINNFSDGVYFVPLQSLESPDQIIPAIAEHIYFQFQPGERGPEAQILAFLSNRQMLLCIDNWEHLIEAAPLVNTILKAAPQVKIIATSREKLNLLSETLYVLRGMQFPSWETPEDALDYDAVQLLVDAAQRVRPGWQIKAANLHYVARVCRLTEGMPLGILLAVSWLDVYSLERIVEEIQRNADILESDMRDIPDRQRSIRAVFDYSWEKLKPQEQAALMKMSVFRGGCTPEAAESITAANARILQGLVNKALISRDQHGRYDMHELLRQYAGQYLNQSDIVDEVRDAHMEYYANAIYEQEARLQDSRQVEAVRAITGDFENVRVAWLRAVEKERFDLIDAMQFCLRIYSYFRNRYQELADLFALASGELKGKQDSSLQVLYANIECGRGLLYWGMNRADEALIILEKVQNIFELHGDIRGLAYYLLSSAECQIGLNRWREAEQLLRESLHLMRQIDDKWGIAWGSHVLSFVLTGMDNPQKGDQYVRQAYQIARETGNKFVLAAVAGNIAIADRLDNGELAGEYLYEAIGLARELAIPYRITKLASALARYEIGQGNLKLAEQFARESLESYESWAQSGEANDHQAGHAPYYALSQVAVIKGNMEEAYRLAEKSYRIAWEYSNQHYREFTLRWVALVLCMMGQYREALNHLKQFELESELKLLNKHYYIPPFSFIAVHHGDYELAAELSGLCESPWLDQMPPYRALLEKLENNLDADVYQAAVEKGKQLDAGTVYYELLAMFGEDDL